jgi:hypothetical protein
MQVLKDKAVHFCRIVRELPKPTASDNDVQFRSNEQTDLRLKPEDLAKHVYQQKYSTEMPPQMLEKLMSCIEESQS